MISNKYLLFFSIKKDIKRAFNDLTGNQNVDVLFFAKAFVTILFCFGVGHT